MTICRKKVYFHTNIVAPYRVHQFRMIQEQFPNALFCLNGRLSHGGENVWEESPEDRMGLKYARIASQDERTAGKGRAFFSPRLLWLLLTQRWGSVHVIGAGISGLNAIMLFFSAFIGHSQIIGWSDGCTKDQCEIGKGGWKRRFHVKRLVKGTFVNFGWGKERELRRGIPENRLVNQYFSCDADEYEAFKSENAASERTRIRMALGIGENDASILNVARHLECKRLRDIAQALTLLERDTPEDARRCHIVMIGGGEESSHREILAQLHLVKVHELPPMPPQDVMSYYAAADIFAFPSEGDVWGLVVNEAMSMGVPVICTDVIGASVLVKDGENGFKVPPRDPAALCARILELVRNPELCSKMGDAALATMKEWTSRRGVEELARWIDANC